MKTAFRSVRGTSDMFPVDLAKRRWIENELKQSLELFGFREAETPIIEHLSLFERSLGTGSEVVSKEMFKIESRGSSSINENGSEASQDKMVLRPENTASMLRAVLNAGLHHQFPLHFYYNGPQFRYERPQKGRLRQFHQFGVECFGRPSYTADAECILTAAESLKRLGLLQNTTLKINTLGESEESRVAYNSVLLKHFQEWSSKNELSSETQARIQEGRVLRALDSKSAVDAECIKSAPSLLDHLPKPDVERFNRVVSILQDEYLLPNLVVDTRLVRGLDYYSHTCFEFVSNDDSLTVLAGGRYDGLAKTLGYGKTPVPAIGWAAGLERLSLMSKRADDSCGRLHLMIVPRFDGDSTNDLTVRTEVAKLALRARREGFACRVWDTDKQDAMVKKALKEADRDGTKYVAFLGHGEVVSGKLSLRTVQSGQVRQVLLEQPLGEWDI